MCNDNKYVAKYVVLRVSIVYDSYQLPYQALVNIYINEWVIVILILTNVDSLQRSSCIELVELTFWEVN